MKPLFLLIIIAFTQGCAPTIWDNMLDKCHDGDIGACEVYNQHNARQLQAYQGLVNFYNTPSTPPRPTPVRYRYQDDNGKGGYIYGQ